MERPKIDLNPFYEHAIQQAEIGVHAVDTAGTTIIYNRKMKQIEGLESAELMDRSLLELFRFDREDSTLLRVLQTGEPILNVKQTYWNRRGQEITTINDTYPVREREKLIGAIELSRDVTKLERAMYQPLKNNEEPVTFASITAVSTSMQRVVETAKKAAIARLPALLIGESGTGKEFIAEAIHQAAADAGQFYTLYCHSADQELIHQLSLELKELENGTIFCERIDMMPHELQSHLLHVLENCRSNGIYYIASVAGDPVELIASNRLLKELYYFFSSLSIQIEPLRNRKEDIVPFTESYFEKHRLQYGSAIHGLSEEVKRLFFLYDWPGNLKELEMLLDEIASVAAADEIVTPDLLPAHFLQRIQPDGGRKPEDFVVFSKKELIPLDAYLQEAENYYLQKALNMYDGNVTKAAEALGMSRQNLQYRLRKMKKNEGQS
ncbi:sigma 54-interacting transcriptional regulator [Planococcus lenghuensis]|uniref:Transcriptional regulator n=1 Tax=Planococcus lenghuensis TaxID=2213202 RepID=A0A1Q2KX98_9BACL|nr:sigma 54-interacting transcriptional regulator [Planococcus lenghuensis]AQQ52734.1 transcriptional regulator [Planococcus lenghuensis]